MSLRAAIQDAADRAAELAIEDPTSALDIPKPERIGVGFLAAPILGQSADAWTTIVGLRRGFAEGNPLMRQAAKHEIGFALLKLTVGFGLAWQTNRFAQAGQLRTAKAFSLVSTFLGVVPAAMNVATIRKGER